MTLIDNIHFIKLVPQPLQSTRKSNLILIAFSILALSFSGCSEFVEADPPKNILISETVFTDAATVESALANIYYKLRDQGMVSGNFGLTTLMGIYGDELDYYGTNLNYREFYSHTIIDENTIVSNWWNHAYNLIYAANDIINGLEISHHIPSEKRAQLMGQALFIRAYIHSLLVDIYGDIPYIKTTDYLKNKLVSRAPVTVVYEHIINDLLNADTYLEKSAGKNGERVVPGQNAAKALLARMYLVTGYWDLARATSTALIDDYLLEGDLDKVFLKQSSETIWQLKPGISPKNTQEANQLIIQSVPGQTYALHETLLATFEPEDLRHSHWIASKSSSDQTVTLKYPNKYKLLFREVESEEYSIVFRLAEQYLIRAEALAHLGNISGAQQDLNTIRNRAGLPDTTADTLNALIEAILQERRVELFTEHGRRWFDLKRTGKASEVLGALKTGWQESNLVLPIPSKELELNPNLLPQNNGY